MSLAKIAIVAYGGLCLLLVLFQGKYVYYPDTDIGADEDQVDGLIAKTAVRLLEESKDKPFFIGIGFEKPHDPFYAPKQYFELYPEGSTKLPILPANRSERVKSVIPNEGFLAKFENSFASFTDKERRECLNREQLWSRGEAQSVCNWWREVYNYF